MASHKGALPRHLSVASFQDALSNHRKVLAAYMAEWSWQQECFLARYADEECRELTATHPHGGGVCFVKGAGRSEQPTVGPTVSLEAAARPIEEPSSAVGNRHVAELPRIASEAPQGVRDAIQQRPRPAKKRNRRIPSRTRSFLEESQDTAPVCGELTVEAPVQDTPMVTVLSASSTTTTREDAFDRSQSAARKHSDLQVPLRDQQDSEALEQDTPNSASGPLLKIIPEPRAEGEATQALENSAAHPLSERPLHGAPMTATKSNFSEWGMRALISSSNENVYESSGPRLGVRISVPTALITEGLKRGISFAPGQRPGNMKSPRSGFVTRLVESPKFIFMFAVIIMANVAFMAVSTEHMLESAKQGEQPNFTIIAMGDVFFSSCYVIELLLKLSAFGSSFFVGPEWKWNVFDVVVVISAIMDLIAPLFMHSGVNVTYLRINRIAKLIKMLRVVKVYLMFKELRLIVASVMGCLKIMFWAVSLIAIVVFTFALLFVQAVTDYVTTRPAGDYSEVLIKYWGSILQAMISLFQSSTGGADWYEVAAPLWDMGWAYYFAFMLYICFFMLVVVNVLTGLFVDATLNASIKDDAMMIREEMNNKQEYVNQIQTLFHRLSDKETGELTWQDFEKGMHSADMLAFASALGLEISDVTEFFKLISADGRDVVDIEKFVVGCMKLKGSAKSLDVVSLLHRTKMLDHQVKRFIGRTDRRLAEQQALVKRVFEEQQKKEPMMRCPGGQYRCPPDNFAQAGLVSDVGGSA